MRVSFPSVPSSQRLDPFDLIASVPQLNTIRRHGPRLSFPDYHFTLSIKHSFHAQCHRAISHRVSNFSLPARSVVTCLRSCTSLCKKMRILCIIEQNFPELQVFVWVPLNSL